MVLEQLPELLTRPDGVERISRLLLEKEHLRRGLQEVHPGRRVSDDEEARRLLHGVIEVFRDALNLEDPSGCLPKVALSRKLSKLPRALFSMYAVLFPVALGCFIATFLIDSSGAALWVVRGVILLMLAIPLPAGRRVRLNIEHNCRYVRTKDRRAIIAIDQLPTVQFQSFLAHEYAHHLFYQRFGAETAPWIREGWARLVQWRYALFMHKQDNNPAHLAYALEQIIGELKYCCQLLCYFRGEKVPASVKKVRTMYHRNPFYRLVMGTPGFRMEQLVDHALGTGCFFRAEQDRGTDWAISQAPVTWSESEPDQGRNVL